MKQIVPFIAFCWLFGSAGIAQVTPAGAPDTPVWGNVNNTGLAIAPFYHIHAVAFDDPSGAYTVHWLDQGSGAVLDMETQPGQNPDIAYFATEDAVAVAYEQGGGIWVDDYYLMTPPSSADYTLGTNNFVSTGINPNIDINSAGFGVLTWEDNGFVFMCSFNLFGFTPGTIVPVAPGTMPDVALFDNSQDLVLTYVQNGNLITETYDYASITTPIPSLILTSLPVQVIPSGVGFEWPRVQSNRHVDYGSSELYTVVAQEDMGGLYDVYGYFYSGPGILTATNLVNDGVNFCMPSYPRPVVAYDRLEVHIAWSQDYTCAGLPPINASERDILMIQYDHMGNYAPGSTTPATGTFQEVNQTNSSFTFSATSLSTEYDGGYGISQFNCSEGIVFNDPGDLFWKSRCYPVNNWKTGDDLEDPITIVKSPDEGQIKVTVEGMESESEAVTFTLVDNSGRQIQLSPATQSGNEFTLDASTLSNGIYLLNCTVGNRTKTERIAHFK